MVGELVLSQGFDFVVREICFRQIGPLLQDNHAKAVGRKFLGEDSAGSAGAYDHKIDFIGSFVLGLVDHHFLSASFGMGCQPA